MGGRDYLGIFRNSSTEQERAKVDKKIEDISKKSMFETALVIDFVSNPNAFLEEEVKIPEIDIPKRAKVVGSALGSGVFTNSQLYRSGMRVNNTSFLDIMPPNSIIGYTISQKNPELTVLFPFFPTHFSMPVKPGEKVWYFYDYTGGIKVGYWLHRKIGTKYTEDVNYTDDIRQTVISYLGLGSATDPISEEEYKKAIHTFLSGLSPEKGYDDSRNLDTNRIHGQSTSYKSFKGAVTPPAYKKCSDFVLQGSNNSKIIMSNTENNNTGEIRITAGYDRDAFIVPAIKNHRPTELADLEYEEYDKFFEGSPLLKNNLGKPSAAISGLKSALQGENNAHLPEPANICIKEHQEKFSKLSNLSYYERSGQEKNESSDDFTGNIVLKTRSSGDMLGKKEAVIDLLGPDLKITNTSNCHFHMRDDGNISIKSNSNVTGGPYVILGGENSSESEPVVLGDTLANILNDLITAINSMTVGTAVGPSTTPINFLAFEAIGQRINTIKSSTSRVK